LPLTQIFTASNCQFFYGNDLKKARVVTGLSQNILSAPADREEYCSPAESENSDEPGEMIAISSEREDAGSQGRRKEEVSHGPTVE
jgi:hypothetical protein